MCFVKITGFAIFAAEAELMHGRVSMLAVFKAPKHVADVVGPDQQT